MPQDKYYLAALEYVREVRAEKGLPFLLTLPRGVKGSASDCPIARAVENGYSTGDRPLVEKFVSRFDAGDYPELIAS